MDDDNAQFISEIQRVALECVARKLSDIGIILPANSGKTVVALSSTYFEDKITLWLTPYRSLRVQLHEECKARQIPVADFYDLDVNKASNFRVLLLSMANIAQRWAYQPKYDFLVKQGLISRVVIDEVHLIPRSSFRPCILSIKHVLGEDRMINRVPFVLLSATAPFHVLSSLCDKLEIDIWKLQVLRAPLRRYNLRLNLIQLKETGKDFMFNMICHHVLRRAKATKQFILSPKIGFLKTMISCVSIRDCEEIQQTLVDFIESEKDALPQMSVHLYHSKLDRSERDASHLAWSDQKSEFLIMIATEGFMVGIHSPNVYEVIYAGGSRNIVDFWQASGRAARNLKLGHGTVFYHRWHCQRANGGVQIAAGSEADSFCSWAENISLCLRVQLEKYLQSPDPGQRCCFKRKNCELCSVCVLMRSSTHRC